MPIADCMDCMETLGNPRSGSGCKCELPTMFCPGCEQLINKTKARDGLQSLYEHLPCGVVNETCMRDPRLDAFFNAQPDEGERVFTGHSGFVSSGQQAGVDLAYGSDRTVFSVHKMDIAVDEES